MQTEKIKFKDTFYYDLNTGRVVQEDFSGYTISSLGNSDKLNILAKDSSTSKNLSSELITMNDILGTVFATSNITDRDESYTYVTDIKFKNSSLGKTGRKEYQKNITSEWVLASGEKIS